MQLKVRVSNGTYIRQLFHDIAETFNERAILTKLVRLKVGEAKVEDSLDLQKIDHWDDVLQNQVQLDQILDFPKICLTEDEYGRVINGNCISNRINHTGTSWLKHNNKIICLGICSEKSIQPKIVWN